LSEPYRITANAAYPKRRRGARRRNTISLDEILPSFHKDGRYVELVVDWSTELADPAVQTELRTALTSALCTRFRVYNHERFSMAPQGRTPAEKLAAFSTVPAAV